MREGRGEADCELERGGGRSAANSSAYGVRKSRSKQEHSEALRRFRSNQKQSERVRREEEQHIDEAVREVHVPAAFERRHTSRAGQAVGRCARKPITRHRDANEAVRGGASDASWTCLASSSEAIGSDRKPSEAIRSDRKPSEAIGRYRKHSRERHARGKLVGDAHACAAHLARLLEVHLREIREMKEISEEAISGHTFSEAIRSHPKPSEAIRSHPRPSHLLEARAAGKLAALGGMGDARNRPLEGDQVPAGGGQLSA